MCIGKEELIKELERLAMKVMELSSKMSDELTIDLKDYLEFAGYERRYLDLYGSNYPLILMAIKEYINPN